jgi:hypothetical protein
MMPLTQPKVYKEEEEEEEGVIHSFKYIAGRSMTEILEEDSDRSPRGDRDGCDKVLLAELATGEQWRESMKDSVPSSPESNKQIQTGEEGSGRLTNPRPKAKVSCHCCVFLSHMDTGRCCVVSSPGGR